MIEWKWYRRPGITEMTPWSPDIDMTNVSVSQTDRNNGSPKSTDMIARDPNNRADQWLVAGKYFSENFEEIARRRGL